MENRKIGGRREVVEGEGRKFEERHREQGEELNEDKREEEEKEEGRRKEEGRNIRAQKLMSE